MSRERPTVVVVGGHHLYALQVLAELKRDLAVETVAVGSEPTSPVVRSRYADEGLAIDPADDQYFRRRLVEEIQRRKPALVLPVGYRETTALAKIRADVPEETALLLPPDDALATALNKSDTMAVAERIGIDVPETLARIPRPEVANPSTDLETLPYPVFLKAEQEAGENIVARVDDPGECRDALADLDDKEGGGDILVQEYVEGDGSTYACGLLVLDGEVGLSCTHRELRSIPREGGTGTRVRLFEDETLESQARALLSELDWTGPALVEFRRRPDGTYSLMEINPKFWASYALASKHGYRFATEMAEHVLGKSIQQRPTPSATGEMVFPIREWYYALKHDEESIARSIVAMGWPPARPDVNLRDARAYLLPAGPRTTLRWLVGLWRGTTDPAEEVRG